MQKNDLENIDFKIKSMLENASVTPSESVWKGIESRLDPVPAKGGKGAWLWGFGFAGAAAALALALIVSKPAQEASFNARSAVAVVQDTPAQNVAQALDTQVQPAPSASHSVKPEERISDENLPAERIREERISEESTEGTEQIIPEKDLDRVESIEKIKTATEKEIEETAGYESDPFERMEMEDRLADSKSHGLRITANGSVGESIGISRLAKNPMRVGGLIANQELTTGIYESGASVYGVPVSFGIGLNIPIKGIFSIETGIDYSILTRSFEGMYTEVDALGANTIEGNVLHHMHYIGIPLSLNVSLYSNRKINFYSLIGGEVEYCVSNIYTIRGPQSEIRFRDPVKMPQFSVKLGVGLEAKLTNHLGLFLDPSAKFYFQNSQPKSIRTEKQLLIGLNMGLRFNL